MVELNDIGYCLDDHQTIYIVDTIWGDGELTVIDISNDQNVRHIYHCDFWALVNAQLS